MSDLVWHNPDGDIQLSYKGRLVASVWFNGTWHTWDRNGIGGENASEDTVEAAIVAAEESCRRQGFIPKKRAQSYRYRLRTEATPAAPRVEEVGACPHGYAAHLVRMCDTCYPLRFEDPSPGASQVPGNGLLTMTCNGCGVPIPSDQPFAYCDVCRTRRAARRKPTPAPPVQQGSGPVCCIYSPLPPWEQCEKPAGHSGMHANRHLLWAQGIEPQQPHPSTGTAVICEAGEECGGSHKGTAHLHPAGTAEKETKR